MGCAYCITSSIDMVTVSWRWLSAPLLMFSVLAGSTARGVIIPTSRGSNLCGDSPTVPLLRDTAESEWREDTELLVSSVMAGRKGVLSVVSPGELVVEEAGILDTPFTMMG